MHHENSEKFTEAFIDYLRQCNAGKEHTTTNNLVGIERTLQEFSDTKTYQANFFWENGGWYTFKGCNLDQEILEIDFGVTYEVRPIQLETFFFASRPDFSCMRLAYQGLPLSGANPAEELEGSRTEEYVKEGDLFLPRSCWDAGIQGYDESGAEIPLNDDAEFIVRELKAGHFLIVSKGTDLNNDDKMIQSLARDGKKSAVYNMLAKKS